MQIADRIIIVTGASAGIGQATAVSLAKRGAHLILTARRKDRLANLAADLAVYPGRILCIAGDIGDTTFARVLIERAITEFGRVDVLINNAGVGHQSALATMPIADAQTIFNVNVLGLLAATQAVIPQMQRQGGGQIVNVSSIVGQRPLPMSGVYCASKTAVNFLSRSLRMELRHDHITITLVYPGLTATEFADAKLGKPGSNRFGLRGVPSEQVAAKIATAIEKQQTEVYVTRLDWAFVHLNRLFPRTFDWLTDRAARRMIF
ncbi:MAG: SDR family NAD(P)-dependent oxidoreductase [Anaerolinea sp.]|nr:SDR family NAD(P)-dependent oxidoreductase [Anaerolinea sp.]